MAAASNRGLLIALAGIALLLAATLAAYRPPVPRGPEASPTAFSAYRAKAILQDLVGNGVAHPIGSPADAQMRDAIVKRLSALGYSTELQSGFVCNDDGECGSPINILATRGAVPADQDAVLLAAHYDSVAAGPGASDDGAGVAGILEIARILTALPPPRHPVVLLISDGEEAGLLGATLFVREHPLAKQVKAAVNMEARGTTGPSLMFETGTANAWLMRLYASAIARPVTNSLYYVVYKQLQNDTDFTVFKAAGYQGFNFAFIGNVGRYHTPLDNAANASAASIQQQGDNALASLWALANSPNLHPPIAESVFFDGFARTLTVWPTAFTLPAALLALALLLAEAVILVRRGAVTGREILWGWVGTLCVLIAGVALCVVLLSVLVAVGKVPPTDGASWIAHPLSMHWAAAAIAFLAAGGVGAWLGRRAGFWGFWVAAALFGAMLSAASALIIPGASFVLLLTAAAAGLGALPYLAYRQRSGVELRWAAEFAALLPTLTLFAAVLPLLGLLYTAIGSPAWPVSTLVLCLGTITLLPLLAAASSSARRAMMGVAALIVAGGTLITLALPTYSADWPERVNLEYWIDADTGQSHYLALCDSLRLPAPLAAAAQFSPVPRARFVGSGSLGFYAAAPTLALGAPELSIISPPTPASPSATTPPVSGTSHFELRLRSARGAPEALVVFPASARVADIGVETTAGPVRVKLTRMRSGATLFDVVGLSEEGVKFNIDAAGPLPVAVQVFDQSYALPEEAGVLQRARPSNATSSQDGDLTVVHRTVSLGPAAGR